MKNAVVTRIACEVSFLLAIVSGAFSCGKELPAMLVFVAALLLCGFAAVQLEHGVLRFLIALLPAVAGLVNHTPIVWVAMGLAMVYFVLVMTLGSFDVDASLVHFIFEVMAVFCLILLLTFIAKAVSTGEKTDVGLLVFSFLFFLLGIITLRRLRMDATLKFRQRLGNAAVVLIPAAVGVAASVLLYLMIRFLGPYIMKPLNLLLQWLYSLFDHDFVHQKKPPLQIDEHTIHVPETVLDPNAYKDAQEELVKDQSISDLFRLPDQSVRWDLIVGAAVILLFLVLIVIYVCHHRKRAEMAAEIERSEGGAGERRRRHGRTHMDNAEKVRQIYREYLFYLRLKGVEIDREETSLEILDSARSVTNGEADQILRKIYIRARYADAGEITDQDVKTAEECLKALRDADLPK